MNEFQLCELCLTCVVNDDWTPVDDDAAAIATAESLGWIAHDRTEDRGVFRCTICGGDHYGPAEIVTAAA